MKHARRLVNSPGQREGAGGSPPLGAVFNDEF